MFIDILNSTIFLSFTALPSFTGSPSPLVSLVSQANAYFGLFYINSIFPQSLDHFKLFVTYRVITSKNLEILVKIAKIWAKNATFAEFQKAEYDCLHSWNAGKDTLRKAEEE